MSSLFKRRVATLLVLSTVALASCAVDQEGLKNDTKRLKDIVTGSEETEVAVEETAAPSETTEVTEVTEEEKVTEPEVTIETTPEVTATPTPSPTPTVTVAPTDEPKSRVDLSELTDTEIIEGFTVEEEAFSENYGLEEDSFVVFEGTRLLISMADNDIPASSVNLILNGFYKEAEGVYNRNCDETQAEYDLTGEVLDKVTVSVNYDYRANDRIIAVRMEYKVVKGEEEKTVTEFEMFDMYTASRITLYDVSDDVSGLIDLMLSEFDEETPKEYDVIMLVPDSDDELLIWMAVDGNFYREHVSIEEVEPLLTRYGKSVYGCL